MLTHARRSARFERDSSGRLPSQKLGFAFDNHLVDELEGLLSMYLTIGLVHAAKQGSCQIILLGRVLFGTEDQPCDVPKALVQTGEHIASSAVFTLK